MFYTLWRSDDADYHGVRSLVLRSSGYDSNRRYLELELDGKYQ